MKPKYSPVCVTAQFPADLSKFLTEHARARGMTQSALLRGLVIDLREKVEEAKAPVMEEPDFLPTSRTLSRIAKTARKGGVL